MFTKFVVEHFKSIGHVEASLGDVTLLVGPNGCGKSNIIDALRFVRDAVYYDIDRAVSDRHGVDSIRQWSPSRPYHVTISVWVESHGGHGEFSLTLGSRKGNYTIIRETGVWHDDVEVLVQREGSSEDEHEQLEFEEDETWITAHRISSYERNKDGEVGLTYNLQGKPERKQTVQISDKDSLFISTLPTSHLRGQRTRIYGRFTGLNLLRSALVDFEAYAIFPNTLRTPQTPSNDQRLSSTGDNLTSVFKSMIRSKTGVESKAHITAALQSVMPSLETIVIQSLGGLMVPTFRVVEPDGNTHTFNVSQISDGTLRVLGLLTALYHPDRPGTIAMEEPEQTVHPGALAVLADSIKDSSRSTQIIVTTHSPNLVDYFEPEQIRAVQLVNGNTKLGKINSSQQRAVKEHLFSLGELMTIEGLSYQ